MNNQYLVSYAESWNRNFSVRHSNLFLEYMKNLQNVTIILDYEQLEKKQDKLSIWEKESKPSVSMGFFNLSNPILTKFSWSYTEEQHFEVDYQKHKPYLQFDISFNRVSVSVFSEYEFTGKDDFGKNSMWLGSELVTSIADHTEVKLFLGKEKGGKVCRNGVCQYQAPFEGLKLSLTTRF